MMTEEPQDSTPENPDLMQSLIKKQLSRRRFIASVARAAAAVQIGNPATSSMLSAGTIPTTAVPLDMMREAINPVIEFIRVLASVKSAVSGIVPSFDQAFDPESYEVRRREALKLLPHLSSTASDLLRQYPTAAPAILKGWMDADPNFSQDHSAIILDPKLKDIGLIARYQQTREPIKLLHQRQDKLRREFLDTLIENEQQVEEVHRMLSNLHDMGGELQLVDYTDQEALIQEVNARIDVDRENYDLARQSWEDNYEYNDQENSPSSYIQEARIYPHHTRVPGHDLRSAMQKVNQRGLS